MDPAARQQAIDLYDRFTHEGMDRRLFIARMVTIAGSVAAAEALIASIAASPAAAAITPADDPRITTALESYGGWDGAGQYHIYVARPRQGGPHPTVMVIHENRGLNEHIRDVARRLAVAGMNAVAPDLLTPLGGTPPLDEDKARDLISNVDLDSTMRDMVGLSKYLSRFYKVNKDLGNGSVGVVGFCWGGAFVNRLAVAAGDTLDAAVSFYGPAPDPAEAAKVKAPMQFHLAGLDTRVAQTAWPWISALGSRGKLVEAFVYPGVNHAFHNDTSAERYDKAAAELAWARTMDFFRRHLGQSSTSAR